MIEELPGNRQAGRFGEIAFDENWSETVVRHGRFVSIHAVMGTSSVAPRHMGNVAVPEVYQVFHGKPRTCDIVGHDAVEEAGSAFPGRHYHRRLPCRPSHNYLIDRRTRKHDSIRSKLKQSVESLLFTRWITVTGVEQRSIASCDRRLLDTSSHLGKKGIVEVRQHHSNHEGSLTNQAACHSVGPVSEVVGGSSDSITLFVRNVGCVAHYE